MGLFTCDRPLQRLYEQAGWDVIDGAVLVGGTVDEPFASDQFDKVTLGAFFTPRARMAAAGFAGSRILLHSGAIDRLW